MYPDLPIEQLVRRKDTRFQLGFATEAKLRLPPNEDFALAPSPKGLRVLGRNEDALGTPVEILRDIYGAKVQVLPPEVRLIEGVQVKQPIMHVRVSMELRFLAAVKRALLERGAVPEEEHARSRYCVLRYLAPLAHLLGLPAELALVTEGTARHWIVLSHYGLVNRDPGGRAA
jgi:predicted membrane GTPase involved in stress response